MVPSLPVSTVVNLYHSNHLATPSRICSPIWFCVRTDHERNCARLEGRCQQQPSQVGSADWPGPGALGLMYVAVNLSVPFSFSFHSLEMEIKSRPYAC